MTDLVDLPSFSDPVTLANPFPVYDVLRAQAPVHRSEELGVVLVTRYDDVMTVLKDTETYSNEYYALRTGGRQHSPAVAAVLAEGWPATNALSHRDGPVHDFQAALVKPFVTPSKVRAMAATIQEIVDELADRLPAGEVVDLVSDFAEELAIAVMCEFVGVSRHDREVFASGADAEVSLLGAVLDEEAALHHARVYVAFQHFIADQVRDRQANPRDDMITLVATASPPDGIDEPTMAERVRIVQQVAVAGNETTRGLITSALLKLATDPELLQRVRGDDAALDGLIEETLRADAPVLALFRLTTRDTELAGVPIAKGEMVATVFGSANYDESMFACPHQFDVDRTNARRHLTFGFGAHYCLGAPLARLEARIAIRSLLDRFGDIRLADGETPKHLPAFIVHNLATLKVVLGRS